MCVSRDTWETVVGSVMRGGEVLEYLDRKILRLRGSLQAARSHRR